MILNFEDFILNESNSKITKKLKDVTKGIITSTELIAA